MVKKGASTALATDPPVAEPPDTDPPVAAPPTTEPPLGDGPALAAVLAGPPVTPGAAAYDPAIEVGRTPEGDALVIFQPPTGIVGEDRPFGAIDRPFGLISLIVETADQKQFIECTTDYREGERSECYWFPNGGGGLPEVLGGLTIQWTATDSPATSDGIGSRYFTIRGDVLGDDTGGGVIPRADVGLVLFEVYDMEGNLSQAVFDVAEFFGALGPLP